MGPKLSLKKPARGQGKRGEKGSIFRDNREKEVKVKAIDRRARIFFHLSNINNNINITNEFIEKKEVNDMNNIICLA